MPETATRTQTVTAAAPLPLRVNGEHAAEECQTVEEHHHDADGREDAEAADRVDAGQLAGREADDVGQTADRDAEAVVFEGALHADVVVFALLGCVVVASNHYLNIVEADAEDEECEQVVWACLLES